MHFFKSSTSKSGPNMSFCCSFDFQMCFAPQWSGVHFFISHLPRWLRTRRFSEPFRSSGATKHWKTHSISRRFYLFAHLHFLSSDSFSSLTAPTPGFPSVHTVGSLSSKLPSARPLFFRSGSNLLYGTHSFHTSRSPRNDPYPFLEQYQKVYVLF